MQAKELQTQEWIFCPCCEQQSSGWEELVPSLGKAGVRDGKGGVGRVNIGIMELNPDFQDPDTPQDLLQAGKSDSRSQRSLPLLWEALGRRFPSHPVWALQE